MVGNVTILDGGMGKELLRIGAPFHQPEWSALALLEAPDFVRQAHQNFADAGATVITTNTYAVVPFHLGEERFTARGAELASLAASIARQVADGAGPPVQVAGSLPPLFGSYEPDKFDAERAPGMYRILVESQMSSVDFWLAETMSSTAEFDAIADAVAGDGRPFWASFTLDDDAAIGSPRIRSGESIREVVRRVGGRAEAILFNCSQPEHFTAAIAEASAALGDTGMRVGGYANAFVDKEPGYGANEIVLEHREDLTPSVYASMAAAWVASGASIIGGCCGIRPDHIAALAAGQAAATSP